ncbi:hypothetical protein KM043_017161 [Ampulex compressa]|nr:hypothetical protein KM043_017161 [Ampulex compressa]
MPFSAYAPKCPAGTLDENNVKPANSQFLYGMMRMSIKRSMDRSAEERLREAACVGDATTVKKLLDLDVDVNARHFPNAWTALHWACKGGHFDVAYLLITHGADKDSKSDIGETPASLCTNPDILPLLSIPNNIQRGLSDSTVHCIMPTESSSSRMRDNAFEEAKSSVYSDELVLKIRIAEGPDPDFVEIELPRNDLSYQSLMRVCCQELNLGPNQVVKLRKLPNTRLRKDKDIQRLQNFQEIEVVTNAVSGYKYTQSCNGIPNIPTVPANGYQSISKKDQTILY